MSLSLLHGVRLLAVARAEWVSTHRASTNPEECGSLPERPVQRTFSVSAEVMYFPIYKSDTSHLHTTLSVHCRRWGGLHCMS